jgi:hypothetical protein
VNEPVQCPECLGYQVSAKTLRAGRDRYGKRATVSGLRIAFLCFLMLVLGFSVLLALSSDLILSAVTVAVTLGLIAVFIAGYSRLPVVYKYTCRACGHTWERQP